MASAVSLSLLLPNSKLDPPGSRCTGGTLYYMLAIKDPDDSRSTQRKKERGKGEKERKVMHVA